MSLDMAPHEDTFISGALDDGIRLWDLRTDNCQGYVNVKGSPVVAFDPSGKVFTIALNKTLRLFDSRNYEKGPFAILKSQQFTPEEVWNNIKFSNNGRDLLISTNQERLYIIDSFDNKIKTCFTDYENASKIPIDACFSPDGQFVLSGYPFIPIIFDMI